MKHELVLINVHIQGRGPDVSSHTFIDIKFIHEAGGKSAESCLVTARCRSLIHSKWRHRRVKGGGGGGWGRGGAVIGISVFEGRRAQVSRSSVICSRYDGASHHVTPVRLCWPQIRAQHRAPSARPPSAAPDGAKLTALHQLERQTDRWSSEVEPR